ncbi:hypothetical protein [Streptomyces flaveolus]|uniref:hypothetical protein n=1 Tax=Streptomyces flaveolus TaxID=67297 RepID=UPI0038232C30
MFEIRIICDPDDTVDVVAALRSAFTTGVVRQYPARDGNKVRLYVTAEQPTAPVDGMPL